MKYAYPAYSLLLEAYEIFFASNWDEAKPSGQRRGAGEKGQREVGGISRLSSYRLISGFPVQFLNNRWDSGTNRAATCDLAKGADRADILGGVQVCSTGVLNLADPGNFIMVVKDFGRKKVNFTREQHAHHQGAHPMLVSLFPQRLNLTIRPFLPWTRPARLT